MSAGVYCLLSNLDDLIALNPLEIHLQASTRQEYSGDGIPIVTSSITLTCLPPEHYLSAARITVERSEVVSPIGKEREAVLPVINRLEQAVALVREELDRRLPGVIIRAGTLALPGLVDDLPKLRTNHNLWIITKGSIVTRKIERLPPQEQQHDA